ncbi:MAG TPA: hypothetical protein DCX06_12300 [Opitutae bacterium]|nr:hypothetical protein [Opitutae bacterium]
MPSVIDKSGQLDYFGRLSWGNFFDWLITFCLGAIIALFTVSLGGVRADTHVVLLPLFLILIVLHCIWLALDDEYPKRLSHVPLFFAPFMIWAVINVEWISPAPWLGRIELIYGMEAFLFFWVAVNNVRTRAHLWSLIVIAMSPAAYAIFIGFYQFFQNPSKMADSLASHAIQLSPEFFGQATGSFADPNSFAVLLLVLLPAFLIAGGVPRLPMILRVLCVYVSVMFIFALAFTQLFWPLMVLSFLILMVPSFCYRQRSKRLILPFIGVTALLSAVALMVWMHPKFLRSFENALSPEGESVRLALWSGAIQLFQGAPFIGIGGGAFPIAFGQSAEIHFDALAQSPHNDFLLVLTEYGAIGSLLLLTPIAWLVLVAFRRWRMEPDRVKLKGRKGSVMPPQKFFLSVALSGFIIFLICACFSFILYVPALMFYGLLFAAILVKSSTNRRIKTPSSGLMRTTYGFSGLFLAFLFFAHFMPRLQSHALELQMRQRLDHLTAEGIHISGNKRLLKNVVYGFEDALLLDSANTDALIGLSAANCQRYFQNPSEYSEIGKTGVTAALRATQLSGGYGLAWAQLGIAHAMSGEHELAKSAFEHALELAPNNSNVHYYWAAFLSPAPEMRDQALASVRRALELNPNNQAARQLQQKLLIF